MKFFVAVMTVLTIFFQTGLTWAQEEKLNDDRLLKIEEELIKIREDQEQGKKALEEIKKEPKMIPPSAPQEMEKLPIKIGASITLRYDRTETEDQADLLLGDNEIEGLRTRVRLSFEYNQQGRLAAGMRLSTGENPNPTSPFIRLGDASRSKSFNLDQFYIVYRPLKSFEEISFTIGKMPLPFWRGDRGSWRTEMIWDDDINPEGVALRTPILSGSSKISIENTAGYFTINEVTDNVFSGLTGDTYLFADQINVRVDQGTGGGTLAVAIYDYHKLNAGLQSPNFTPGSGGFVTPGASALLVREGLQHTNNQVNYGPGAEGFLDERFTSLNLTAQLYHPISLNPMGLEVFWVGDYVKNMSVDQDERGYGVTGGLRGGGKGRIAPFNLWYTYREVDADATLATFADSDLGAGTAYKGFEFVANYRILSDLLVQFSYFDFEGFPRKDNNVTRMFVDLVKTF
jgi:hypothetical protein